MVILGLNRVEILDFWYLPSLKVDEQLTSDWMQKKNLWFDDKVSWGKTVRVSLSPRNDVCIQWNFFPVMLLWRWRMHDCPCLSSLHLSLRWFKDRPWWIRLNVKVLVEYVFHYLIRTRIWTTTNSFTELESLQVEMVLILRWKTNVCCLWTLKRDIKPRYHTHTRLWLFYCFVQCVFVLHQRDSLKWKCISKHKSYFFTVYLHI